MQLGIKWRKLLDNEKYTSTLVKDWSRSIAFPRLSDEGIIRKLQMIVRKSCPLPTWHFVFPSPILLDDLLRQSANVKCLVTGMKLITTSQHLFCAIGRAF